MAIDRAAILARTPSSPGVYLMRDASGDIFYVGKARDLRKRLAQYLGATSDDRPFVRMLDHLLAEVEVLVTANEKEALVLENQLVKEHQPRFNVLLKDDKNFLRLRIDARHAWPRVEIVRRRKDDGAEYYGPYASALTIREVVHLVNRVFRLRTCDDRAFATRDRPCLRHQMHLCDAPCTLPVDAAAYRARVDDVRLFLKGKRRELQRRLAREMDEASAALDFERALTLRDMLKGIEKSAQTQAVDLHGDDDLDVWALHRVEERAVAFLANVRGGLTLYVWEYPLRRLAPLPDGEILAGVLQSHYDRAEIPTEILVPIDLDDEGAPLADWLTERAGRRVSVHRPQRGPRRALLDWAAHNAAERLRQTTRLEEKRYAELAELAVLLRLPTRPSRLECYDISNIHGDVAYGSQVVFVDGVPDKSAYRSYRIRGVQGSDDFAMLQEVLRRRLTGDSGGDLPDVFVIDGGKGQVGAARAVVHDELHVDRPVVGLAKDRVRRDPHALELTHSDERLVHGDPLVETPLANDTGLHHLLVRLRDEAHRFAVSAHRKARTARDLEGALDRVPGIGKKRKRELLMRYATIARLIAVMEKDGWKIKGLPAKVVEALRKAVTEEGAAPDSAETDVRSD